MARIAVTPTQCKRTPHRAALGERSTRHAGVTGFTKLENCPHLPENQPL